ncbi:AP-2 complex subunit beta [Striga asiatica]|uniref:AP-2 complex subunit beta n=1 Tax=Striga asiatica TaxID=4170 RepID=A0A5A7PDF6_STRAF|nr:AP-2 complex subunit beta [Striga asiatica]
MDKEENRVSKQEVEDGIGIGNSTIGYDPNRIPASIFSTKPTNPSEWSVASNESLFSIHMPNNSFSRDYAILYGKSADLQDFQLRMSGELPRLDEWNKSQLKSSELIGLPSVVEETWPSLDQHEMGKQGQPNVVSANQMVITKIVSSPHTFSSPPRFSHDIRNNSASSFVFPL